MSWPEAKIIDLGDGLLWALIPSYPDYVVSSTGLVQRIRPDCHNHKLSGKPLRSALMASGYVSVVLANDDGQRSFHVHRVLCWAFHGAPPTPKHQAAHNDGVRHHNTPENLRWATAKENSQDRKKHGTWIQGGNHWTKFKPERMAIGEARGSSKLKDEEVRKIRADPRPSPIVALEYGVNPSTVRSLRRGETWRHLL